MDIAERRLRGSIRCIACGLDVLDVLLAANQHMVVDELLQLIVLEHKRVRWHFLLLLVLQRKRIRWHFLLLLLLLLAFQGASDLPNLPATWPQTETSASETKDETLENRNACAL